jgi:hypothetical protein
MASLGRICTPPPIGVTSVEPFHMLLTAVAAAFIQDQDYYELANWKPSVFNDEAKYPVETLNTPKQVASAVNSMWKGSTLVTPIGGGVQMRPSEAISPTNLLDDEDKAVAKARTAIDLSTLADDQWWWD